MTVGLLYDEAFLRHDLPGHPECAARVRAIVEHFRAVGLWTECRTLAVRAASEDEIRSVHRPEHMDRLVSVAARGGGMLDPDTYLVGGTMEAAFKSAGAAVAAVEAVVEGRVRSAFAIARPPGHHARPGRAMGFCLFNNAAIAARRAQALGVGRVLIVDWDVHHGNGTQEVFYEDPTVFYFSIHRWPFYPGTGSEHETGAGAGEGFTRNIPVRYGTPPETTLRRFEAAVREIAHSFRPDLTIISAGFDAYRDDPIGGLDLLPEHFAAMTDAVVRETGKGVVSLLEGGYALDALGRLAEAHVARLAAASVAG